MKAFRVGRLLLMNLMVLLALVVSPLGPAGAAAPAQADEPPWMIYLPMVEKINEGYEPNETMEEAFGPLVSGTKYTAYINTDTDLDYYFIDVATLGMVTVELSNINAPTTNLNLFLYDASGVEVGYSRSSSAASEKITFLPMSTGRYYILVNFYRYGWVNTPGQPYYLTATLNQAVGAGDIWGSLAVNNSLLANWPVNLELRDDTTQTYTEFFTVTDLNGIYHFRGQKALTAGQSYTVYFEGKSSGYVGYASTPTIDSYTAGETLPMGTLDASPIILNTPDSATAQPFPVTLTWTPRTTSPAESYRIHIYRSQSWWSGLLGHVGSLTLTGLPSGLNTNQTYSWYVCGYGPSGGAACSYWAYDVAFSNTGAGILPSAQPMEQPFFMEREGAFAGPEREQ